MFYQVHMKRKEKMNMKRKEIMKVSLVFDKKKNENDFWDLKDDLMKILLFIIIS